MAGAAALYNTLSPCPPPSSVKMPKASLSPRGDDDDDDVDDDYDDDVNDDDDDDVNDVEGDCCDRWLSVRYDLPLGERRERTFLYIAFLS